MIVVRMWWTAPIDFSRRSSSGRTHVAVFFARLASISIGAARFVSFFAREGDGGRHGRPVSTVVFCVVLSVLKSSSFIKNGTYNPVRHAIRVYMTWKP